MTAKRRVNVSNKWTTPIVCASLLLCSLSAFATPPPNGVAPVIVPAGGFAIDGDLLANTPGTNTGDWLASTSGTGGGVLDAAGVPLEPSRTFHFIDAFNSTSDLIFSGGLKWTDNPNSWQWTASKASSKTDINNVLLHISTDTNGHIWTIVAADRLSTSGESYIDFEFLQSTLVRSNNSYFASSGPNGGRTTNDLLLSLAFISGGAVADFLAYRWVPDGSGGFGYVDITASLPVGRVFVALNSNTIAVPYGAFGLTTYAPNAFAEAAVDMTALIGNFDPCFSFGFKTIMVKTKSSSSSSASISDFIDPIQFSLRIGPSADAGPDQARCSGGATTDFPLHGAATAGVQPIASTTWSVISGTATVDSPGSLATTAHLVSGSATLRLTVVEVNGCTKTDDIVLTVLPLQPCLITGPAATCPSSVAQFSGPPGAPFYSWSVSGNGSISGPKNGPGVTVVAGNACGTNFTVQLDLTITNSCPSVCRTDVMVSDTNPPTLFAPTDVVLECPADTGTNNTGVATAQDDCGQVTLSYSDVTTNVCPGTKVISRTWTATDRCGNTANTVQTITVRDTTPPNIVAPANLVLECPAVTMTNVTGVAAASDGCGSVGVSYNDVTTTNCGNSRILTRTWTATDQCGNRASAVQTITVRDTKAPSILVPANVTLECPAVTTTNVTGTATATDTCSQVSVGYSDSVSNSCGGAKVISRTWTATDLCGNSASAVQMITLRDTTRPTLTCPPNLTLECGASTAPSATGTATAQDACSAVTLSYSDSVSNICGGSKVITRTWTAVDGCGNSASCQQTITVLDTTPPNIGAALPIVCTYSQGGFAGGGYPAQLFASKYTTLFPNGLTLGIYNPTNGNAAPNGLFWQGNSTGLSALQTAFGVNNGPGLITQDAINPTGTYGAGSLGRQALALTLNIALNAAGVIGTPPNNFSSLVYTNSGDSLSGQTISQILALANRALAGLGFPTGYDASSLAGLLNNLNISFEACSRSAWAAAHLSTPGLLLQCPSQVPAPNPADVVVSDSCSSPVTLTNLPDVISDQACPSRYTVTRTWVARDACGNASSYSFKFIVNDTTPPILTCPPDRTLSATQPWTFDQPVATDNCGGATVQVLGTVSNLVNQTSLAITRTWLASDPCGNTATCQQTVTLPNYLTDLVGNFRLTPGYLTGGQFSLSTPGVPGYNVIIQFSTNLTTWVNVVTNASPCTFVDSNAWQYPQRFYRAILAP